MINITSPHGTHGSPLTEETIHFLSSEHYVDPVVLTENGRRFHRDLISFINDNYKFIFSSDGKHELYNLDEDPEENNNLFNHNNSISKTFLEKFALLNKIIPEKKVNFNSLPKIDKEDIKKLRSLGYIK